MFIGHLACGQYILAFVFIWVCIYSKQTSSQLFPREVAELGEQNKDHWGECGLRWAWGRGGLHEALAPTLAALPSPSLTTGSQWSCPGGTGAGLSATSTSSSFLPSLLPKAGPERKVSTWLGRWGKEGWRGQCSWPRPRLWCFSWVGAGGTAEKKQTDIPVCTELVFTYVIKTDSSELFQYAGHSSKCF